MSSVQSMFSGLSSSVSNISLSGNSWRAFAIVGLIFLLVLLLAKVRRHYIDWSFKGALFGIFFGFLLALFLEGFLVIGGRTALTEVMGWKNAPKPLQLVLDSGRSKLVQVLGIKDEVPQSSAYGDASIDGAVSLLQSLDPTEIKKVKALICQP